MDDTFALPREPNSLEIWIHRQEKKGKLPTFIADELLKSWSQGHFSIESKLVIGRYCILNGFFSPIVRILRHDLNARSMVPWALIIEVLSHFTEISKELADAILTGATRDKDLFRLALFAIRKNHGDLRWSKILESEYQELKDQKERWRQNILNEATIFKNEGMTEDMRKSLLQILAVYPDDATALEHLRNLDDMDLDNAVKKIRRQHDNLAENQNKIEESPQWSELKEALEKIKSELDISSAYHLAVGLHQMGFEKDALLILQSQRKNWQQKEKLFEIELLLANKHFAEALQISQEVLKTQFEDHESIHAALYFSALAFNGLGDQEQAVNVLKGLLIHRPNYRDSSLLIKEWESQSK